METLYPTFRNRTKLAQDRQSYQEQHQDYYIREPRWSQNAFWQHCQQEKTGTVLELP